MTIPIPPLPFKRLLSRIQAAYYIDHSVSKFDQFVADGRMPKPLKIDRRRVWDRHQLDPAIDALRDAGDALHDADPETNDWD